MEVSINNVRFDVEEYIYEQAIPKIQDPLPYKKSESVFLDELGRPISRPPSDQNADGTTSARNDPRLRTVVCRHWMKGLCMKGERCEFLHQFDLEKMPLCRHGDKCKTPDCPFRHIKEEDRMECVFYKQGFCIHGGFCRYKHTRRDRIDRPLVCDYTLGLSQMQAGKEGVALRRPASRQSDFFKVTMCKHYMQGNCPFGDGCHFAHGKEELAKHKAMNPKFGHGGILLSGGIDERGEIRLDVFGAVSDASMDYFEGLSVLGGKTNPVSEPKEAGYFLLSTPTYKDLAMNIGRGGTWVSEKMAEDISREMKESKTGQVVVFFTVVGSFHLQAVGIVKSVSVEEKEKKRGFQYPAKLDVEFFRSMELHADIVGKEIGGCCSDCFKIPTKEDGGYLVLTKDVGEAVLGACWNTPLATLHEPTYLCQDKGALEDTLNPFFTPYLEDGDGWPITQLPGFIFGCSTAMLGEGIEKGIFGLPMHMKLAASKLRPGATLFVYNISDGVLHGIFECVEKAEIDMDPKLFSKNPNSTTSPFPVQVKVRVALEAPPLEGTDIILKQLLRDRGGVPKVGPLTYSQCKALSDLITERCGVHAYMERIRGGKGDPMDIPISLPPEVSGIGIKEGMEACPPAT